MTESSDEEDQLRWKLKIDDNYIPERGYSLPQIPEVSLIEHFLTPEECQFFIDNLIFPSKIDTGEVTGHQKRVCSRLKLDHPELAEQFLKRVQAVIPQQLVFEEEDDDLGPFLVGTWRLSQLNERISFLKYEAGGIFERHRDGVFVYHEDKRSFITILIYLNGDYTDGRTKVFTDDLSFEFAVVPTPGLAVSMTQRVLHEGGIVTEGLKYVIRIDAIYEREGVYDKEKLEKNQLAEQYLRMAGELERSSKGMEAVEYYQKAFRLNPQLENFT